MGGERRVELAAMMLVDELARDGERITRRGDDQPAVFAQLLLDGGGGVLGHAFGSQFSTVYLASARTSSTSFGGSQRVAFSASKAASIASRLAPE